MSDYYFSKWYRIAVHINSLRLELNLLVEYNNVRSLKGLSSAISALEYKIAQLKREVANETGNHTEKASTP